MPILLSENNLSSVILYCMAVV